MQPSLTVHFEPKPKPPHKVCSTQHTTSIPKPPLDAAAGRRPKRRPLSSARRPYRFAPRLRVTQLTKGENDDEEEETGSSRKQQKSACFALPWCVDFHALFTFPSVVSQVRGARPSVGPERAKRKLGGKTSRTSRVFPSGFFGDRIFVLCGFLQKEGKARLRA